MQIQAAPATKKLTLALLSILKVVMNFQRLETSPSFGQYINDFYTLDTLRNLTVKCCLFDFYEEIHDVFISLICCHVTDFSLITGEKVWNINI